MGRLAQGVAARPRLLVNGVSAELGGGLSFLVSQLRALTQLDELDITVYASEQLARSVSDLSDAVDVIPVSHRSLGHRVFWEQCVLPAKARAYDVVYMPGNFAMFIGPRPQVVTLQNALHFGDDARAIRERFYSPHARFRLVLESALARLSARRADRVITVSEALRRAVEQDLGRLDHLLVIRSATPTPSPAREPAESQRSYNGRYVLTVAHDTPNKDWDGLIQAFLENADLPMLVIAGSARSTQRLQELNAALGSGDPKCVELAGAVTDPAWLDSLYRGALCYVAHSFLESFGFTPCEALSRRVPIAASDIPAHREVCGAAAIYYNPNDHEGLGTAVRAAAQQSTVSQIPTTCGRTWDENARELVTILKVSAGSKARGPASLRKGTDRN